MTDVNQPRSHPDPTMPTAAVHGPRSDGTILIDVVAGIEEAFDASFLERNDHPVVVCHGRAPGTMCPLMTAGECVKYEQAHGVVFQLDLDRPQHRAIVERYHELTPEVPFRVVARGDQARRHGGLISRVQRWTHKPTAAELDGFAVEVEAADQFASQMGASR